MEVLVKETVTLHKLLSRYLSVPIVEVSIAPLAGQGEADTRFFQFVMSQVLAAINHNLQEEYSAIRLPNQEAKDRLLADAKFLHEKLSALKNIPGASTAMLVTVVSEKVPANAPKRIPANQRIKGMLYRSTGNTQEDAAAASVSPSRAPTPRPNSPVPPRPESPLPVLSPQPVHSPANGTSTTSRPTTPGPSPPLPPLPSQVPESVSTQPNGLNGH